MMRTLLIATTIAIVSAGPALAQEAERILAPATIAAAGDVQVNQVRTPGDDLDGGLGGIGVTFTADGDDKTVSLVATRTWQDVSGTTLATNSVTGKVFTDVTDDDDKSGFFATDVGRVRGTGLTLSLNRSWSPNSPLPGTPEQRDAAVAEARARCLARVGTEGSTLTNAFCQDNLTALGDILPHLAAADQVLALQDTWLQAMTNTFGLTLGGASKTFKFRDPSTLASAEVEEINWTVGVHGGQSRIFTGVGRLYYGGGISYRAAYSAADTRTLCAAPPPTGPQECFTAAYGEPEQENGTTLFLVARNQNTWDDWGIPVVLQIKPAYVVETETLGVEASLYMFAGKGGLRGGLRLSLQTDDNDDATDDENARFGIFVGAAF